MAKKIKDWFDEECVELHIEKFDTVDAPFDPIIYEEKILPFYKPLEFGERMDLFAQGLEAAFEVSYEESLVWLHNILGPELAQDTGMFKIGWWLWPIGRYIERNGLQAIEPTLDFIYELTQRFTGEFAMRPLLVAEPLKVLPVVEKWSLDENVHVRRLASECLRPKLPWAAMNSVFVENPEICVRILNNLKTSPEVFVQKSVANNINDLYKVKPDLAQFIVDSWASTGSDATLKIIKHGTRSLR